MASLLSGAGWYSELKDALEKHHKPKNQRPQDAQKEAEALPGPKVRAHQMQHEDCRSRICLPAATAQCSSTRRTASRGC